MDQANLLLWTALLLPFVSAFICLLIGNPDWMFRFVIVVTVIDFGVCIALAGHILGGVAEIAVGSGTFRVDALSVYHLVIMALVFLACTLFSTSYFEKELAEGEFDSSTAKRFGSLWLGTLTAMTLVLVANNLGLMWVGMEMTTLLTAFLITTHGGATALEAMWKYLIVCSVGIAFAFMGTLLCAAAIPVAELGGQETLQWTHLISIRTQLNPDLMRFAFIFLIVGYGTKAGLVPMHTWLPDAHSQAPGPVSAVFSGFMLSSALYCLLRYFPLVGGIDAQYAGNMLIGFAVLSLLIAAAFVIYQKDVKRLLAYSSVEHIGIITLGIGLGPLGAQAALFHTFNHSICKTLGFFSAGRLGQTYGTHDMQTIRGALRAHPLWGVGLLGSLLALIGVAPMSIFMSEFQLARAAVQNNAWWVLTFFIIGTSIIFVSVIKRAIEMAFGTAPANLPVRKERIVVRGLVVVYLAFLLVFGIWMPEPMRLLIDQGAAIVVGAP